jgi:DNA repair exonuclease SbcCD nuclease subunit
MSTVNVLFIGDPHFKLKNVEIIPLFISNIENIINQNKIDFIVVAGDLLDNHDRVDVEPLNLAIDFLNKLSEKFNTFVIVGNHDYKNNQQFLSDHHWMNSFKKWKNITIVDDIKTFSLNNLEFLFVPYVPPGRFIEAINTKIKDLKNFKGVFAHQEFYKCKMGAIESIEGDKWSIDYPTVVSGHIHNKQWVQDNIYYPGSALQHAFGQSENNTISLLTFCKAEPLKYEEIDLKMPKMYIKYITVEKAMGKLKYKNTELEKYKLVVRGTLEEFKNFKKSSRYNELLKADFKIVFKTNHVEEKLADIGIERKKFIDILNEVVTAEGDLELENIYREFMKE